MAERGMIAEARSLVRSCAETAIAIGCLAIDDKFVDALIEPIKAIVCTTLMPFSMIRSLAKS